MIECAIGSDHSGTAIRRPAHGYQNGSLLSRRPPEYNSRPQLASRASCSESLERYAKLLFLKFLTCDDVREKPGFA